MTAGERYVVGQTLSDGWLGAVRLLHDTPGRKAVHLIVRILEPTVEIEEIRVGAQALINANNGDGEGAMPDIATTRNTIFPAAYARRTRSAEELAKYYRDRYAEFREFPKNERGTYFGRIVAYPRADGEDPADQLTDTVRKLRDELKSPSPKSSRYEINIYSERCDKSPMSFPCLAHLSVHLHQRRVHVQAIYRNESLIARGYGNYLGLAELQAYIAESAGAKVGELMITAGHAELDGLKRPITAMLKALA